MLSACPLISITKVFKVFVMISLLLIANASYSSQLLKNYTFTEQDAILVIEENETTDKVLYQWRVSEKMIPASLVKLLTTQLSIAKWGLQHQFRTDFFRLGQELWVKGYGDPFLVSEELDVIADQLQQIGLQGITSINIDDRYFSDVLVPGHSKVDDPYNAPLSAVAANFNTVNLKRNGQQLLSAESQTPLTSTAEKIAKSSSVNISAKPTRVNLKNRVNAQRHFAEILMHKLGSPSLEINVDASLPNNAELIYTHLNSHALKDMLIGAMKYSNNFIANQLFLKLSETKGTQSLNFNSVEKYISKQLEQQYGWDEASSTNVILNEGAGLSRQNRLSAKQIDDVLLKLQANKELLNRYSISGVSPSRDSTVYAHAKTGTLNGVSNFAGFLNVSGKRYRFVFMFNRPVPYGYRDRVLNSLAQELLQQRSQQFPQQQITTN